ncbi:RDD family protein [Candidatus Woesearchaeota archaeon]|nr:RDD family protein [Candidatus Woesearchaeota archaeon]
MPTKLNLPKTRIKEMPARYYKRILFLVIDLFILSFIVYNQFAGSLTGLERSLNITDYTHTFSPQTYYVIYSMTLLTWIYFSVFQRYFGQTPGMKLMGLRIKGNNSIFVSFARNLFAMPVSFIIILWVVEPIYTFIKKQSLMEKLTGSEMVEEITI